MCSLVLGLLLTGPRGVAILCPALQMITRLGVCLKEKTMPACKVFSGLATGFGRFHRAWGTCIVLERDFGLLPMRIHSYSLRVSVGISTKLLSQSVQGDRLRSIKCTLIPMQIA